MSLQSQSKINASKETSISPCTETVDREPENLSISDTNEISIKLKFINDDQKVVAGSLQELLGDFKRFITIYHCVLNKTLRQTKIQ